MKVIFINADDKNIKLPNYFKIFNVEYFSDEEIAEDPECVNYCQYWAEISEENIEKGEEWLEAHNFDFFY